MGTEYGYASFSDAYFDGEAIWFSNHTFNGLFLYNLTDKQVKFCGKFPGVDEQEMLIHKRVVKYENELLFFPNKEFIGVHVYSDLTKEICFCDEGIKDWAKKKVVADVVLLKDKCLIFFKNFSSGMYEYDFKTRTFTENADYFLNIIQQNVIQPEDSILRIFHKEEVIWIPVLGKNIIIKYSILNKKFGIVSLSKEVQIADVFVYNDELIITQINKAEVLRVKNGDIRKYLLNDEKQKVKLLPPNDKWAVYSRIVNVGTEIILLPRCLKELFKLNDSNNRIEKIIMNDDGYEVLSSTRKNWPAYYGYIQYKDELFICPCACNCAIRINQKTGSVTVEPISLMGIQYTEDVLRGLRFNKLVKCLENKTVLKESCDVATLDDFISIIKS